MAICQDCGTERSVLQRHHVEPKSLGGSDDESNVVYICRNCHEDRHEQEGHRPWQLGHTPAAKAKRAESMRHRWSDARYRAKQTRSRKRAWTPERKAKLSAERKQWIKDHPAEWAARGEKIAATKKGKQPAHFAAWVEATRGKGNRGPRSPKNK